MADKKKGFDLASVLSSVSKLDTGTETGREQIEYIELSNIKADERNFYELSGLEGLAASIEFAGLQQPIRVRPDLENEGSYIIVSGHRRHAALSLLVDEGQERFREVPCIVEQPTGHTGEVEAKLQELRLIYGNSDTRRLSSADISKQAERVEALLYELKEAGVEFPGKMRDHVAEACQVSASKLARLKVIREKLIQEWHDLYAADQLPESTAYTIAQMPEPHQAALFERKGAGGKERPFYEGEARRYGEKMEKVEGKKCEKWPDFDCANVSNKIKRICSRPDDYMLTTPCAGCCCKCEYLTSCSYSCDLCADDKQAAKDERKLEKTRKKSEEERRAAEKEQQDREAIDMVVHIRDVYARKKAELGLGDDEYLTQTGIPRWRFDAGEERPSSLYANTPLGLDGDDLVHLCKAADILGVSLDYLLGRADDPSRGQAAPPAASVAWYPSTVEPADGQEIIVVDDWGLADTAKYLGGKLTCDTPRWEDIVLWTAIPSMDGESEERSI